MFFPTLAAMLKTPEFGQRLSERLVGLTLAKPTCDFTVTLYWSYLSLQMKAQVTVMTPAVFGLHVWYVQCS